MADPAIPTTPPVAQEWVAAVRTADPELAGHMELKGWAGKPINEALLEAARAHRGAEKQLGVPSNELIRLPKDPADVAWGDLYSRLGVPKDPKEYSFDGIKFADGTDLDADVAEFIRTEAAALKIPKDATRQFATDYVKYLEKLEAADKLETQSKIDTERAELDRNWGVNKAANMVVAQNAVAALGVDPAAVAALEGQVGYSKVMEMFRAIGVKLGEGRFVTNENGLHGSGTIMTQDSAKAHLDELKRDESFQKRWFSGDVAAKREMENTIKLATGLRDTLTGQ